MFNDQKYKVVCDCIYKLGVLALTAFLCWFFNSAWGCAAWILIAYKD